MTSTHSEAFAPAAEEFPFAPVLPVPCVPEVAGTVVGEGSTVGDGSTVVDGSSVGEGSPVTDGSLVADGSSVAIGSLDGDGSVVGDGAVVGSVVLVDASTVLVSVVVACVSVVVWSLVVDPSPVAASAHPPVASTIVTTSGRSARPLQVRLFMEPLPFLRRIRWMRRLVYLCH
jgi:carbonic anhydrase/acetyltransferase-like protein (isoleucine patch superfamily)